MLPPPRPPPQKKKKSTVCFQVLTRHTVLVIFLLFFFLSKRNVHIMLCVVCFRNWSVCNVSKAITTPGFLVCSIKRVINIFFACVRTCRYMYPVSVSNKQKIPAKLVVISLFKNSSDMMFPDITIPRLYQKILTKRAFFSDINHSALKRACWHQSQAWSAL